MTARTILLDILMGGAIILVAFSIAIAAMAAMILGRLYRLTKKAETGLLALLGWKKWRRRRGSGKG